MKTGDKLRVIENEELNQTTIPTDAICVFIKSFDNYACVSYEGREALINKVFLIPTD